MNLLNEREAKRELARTKIVSLAGAICIETPLKRNKYARAAYVDWDIIEQLRATFADAGYDLEAARAKLHAGELA